MKAIRTGGRPGRRAFSAEVVLLVPGATGTGETVEQENRRARREVARLRQEQAVATID